MKIFGRILVICSLIFVVACSSSYEKLSNESFETHDDFSKYLLQEYKKKADFEAKEMHDWNSAKLYSEKALAAVKGEKVQPQKISYWNISPEKRYDIIKGYNNLLNIYNETLLIDPLNLAKAISSLDCWSEQQEENWQTWDINKCKDDFLNAMHKIYENLSEYEKERKSKNLNLISKKIEDKAIDKKNKSAIITEDKDKNILQIVYFDFDKSNLSSVSRNEIKNFIDKYKKIIKKFIVIGHTDTVGTDEYNLSLSIERASAVKKILIDLGIQPEFIKILGKGEKVLNVKTKDNVPHPANRRAEISPLN